MLAVVAATAALTAETMVPAGRGGGGRAGAAGLKALSGGSGGYGGLTDRVYNHIGRVIGSAYDNQRIAAGVLGQQLGRLGSEYARRGLDVAPTLEIRPGYRFTVMVTNDIVRPPWKG
ncbi:hypothetical protein HL658_18720 [Azospirillum sp. RWY-5-1]|uniref:Conjugal transfer protein TrbI n=1 Tax=Azospirillum oleiclasticum TaxID=2735135 RepID=A0ABX2TLT6_9PROT|nr:hypothetical protein [Azospirillum oleiclasticum]NYZ14588.1 hypothetical protein [Azospirillum oleiclasticum]NYZ24366.1 hypothetical protein [Azospirillum oleiclasticum]